MLKKVTRYVKTGLMVIGLTIAFYLLSAFALSVISTSPEHLECPKDYKIFIASNGVHLDLIIPRKNLPVELADELDLPQWVNFIAFGWGDKEFYINTPTWNDLKFDTSFRALFLDSESAIHVTWIRNEYPGWTIIPMCDSQLHQLMEFVHGAFKQGPKNDILEIEASGYSKYDKFYLAIGNFSFVQTCNNWVNRGLKAAQVKTCVWSPFDQGVLYQARKNSQK
jgi:uncharacterized protein (TIGR02117 family)